MDFNSPTMIKARIMAFAQMGAVVEKMDVSIPVYWISIPPCDDGSYKLNPGEEYTDELPKRIKKHLFQDYTRQRVKMYARVRKDDGPWSREKGNLASTVAQQHLNQCIGWEYQLYVALAGSVENEKEKLRHQFEDLMNGGRKDTVQNQSSDLSIIDVPNFAEGTK